MSNFAQNCATIPRPGACLRCGARVSCCEGFRMTAHRDDAACTGAVVRKPPMKETALGERGAVPRALIYRGLTLAAAVICQHNFCIMARTLLTGGKQLCIMCNFKELRVAHWRSPLHLRSHRFGSLKPIVRDANVGSQRLRRALCL